MQPLAETLKVQNRTLQQVKRQGCVALYELYGPNGMLYGFEVVVAKVRPAEEILGRFYSEREVYPSNEDSGKLLWSYGRNYRDLAEECFERASRLEERLASLRCLDTGAGVNTSPAASLSVQKGILDAGTGTEGGAHLRVD
jgi:hypothetical protein